MTFSVSTTPITVHPGARARTRAVYNLTALRSGRDSVQMFFGPPPSRRKTGRVKVLAVISFFLMALTPAVADEFGMEGSYLYRFQMLRAAPGGLEELIAIFTQAETENSHEITGEHKRYIMRHSQGDQWDLLHITPMGSWSEYYSMEKEKKRWEGFVKDRGVDISPLIAFDEEIYAYGPPLEDFDKAFGENAFFHIEMFYSAPGKHNELLNQRRMENRYLDATGQTKNMIFAKAAGSDVDVFTIGFHKSLKAFAADAPATDEEKEQAAIAAGFKSRADISFYLRSLISAHHDTLAVKVE